MSSEQDTVYRNQMHAIVSLLDDSNAGRVLSIWQDLEVECDLSGIKVTPIPHFSWQIAAGYDFEGLEPVLEEIASQAKPFYARANGLGLFTGEKPVAYVPLVRDANLSAFHKTIWEKTGDLGLEASPHYAPHSWVPHITLASGDLNLQRLTCLMEKFAFQRNDWELYVDNLTVIFQADGVGGLVRDRFQFKG